MNCINLIYSIGMGEYSDYTQNLEIEQFDTIEAMNVRWAAIREEWNRPKKNSYCWVEAVIYGHRWSEEDTKTMNETGVYPQKA